MLLSALLSGVEVSSPYIDVEIRDIRIDSRKDLAGCLYVCIPGTKTDGHRFAAAALEKGAAAILAGKDTGVAGQILVPDTREAYAVICANYFGRPANRLKLAAVTGTNGKTSVATIIQRLLCFAGIPTGLISTIRAEYGETSFPLSRTTPDAYQLQSLFRQMADAGMRAAVMEASSHALDQKRLFGLHFETAAFTNLTQDHLDYHKTMEAYFEAKKKLFSMAGYAVVNIDDEYGRRLLQDIPTERASYSAEDSTADYHAENIACEAEGVAFDLVHADVRSPVSFGIPGLYSVHNALAAIGCCMRLGVSLDTIREGLGQIGAIPGRNERIDTGAGFQVICDYAHTPDGIENILKSTRAYARGRVVILFGCGGDRDRAKRPMMGAAAARNADFLVITSDNPRTEAPGAIIADILKGIPRGARYVVIPDRRDAIRYALATAKPNDTILLAGKGHEQYQTLGEKNLYFDERKLVEGILHSLKK